MRREHAAAVADEVRDADVRRRRSFQQQRGRRGLARVDDDLRPCRRGDALLEPRICRAQWRSLLLEPSRRERGEPARRRKPSVDPRCALHAQVTGSALDRDLAPEGACARQLAAAAPCVRIQPLAPCHPQLADRHVPGPVAEEVPQQRGSAVLDAQDVADARQAGSHASGSRSGTGSGVSGRTRRACASHGRPAR